MAARPPSVRLRACRGARAVTPEIVCLTKSGGPLTKKISLENGVLCSDGSACVMTRGVARRAPITSVGQLGALIGSLRSTKRSRSAHCARACRARSRLPPSGSSMAARSRTSSPERPTTSCSGPGSGISAARSRYEGHAAEIAARLNELAASGRPCCPFCPRSPASPASRGRQPARDCTARTTAPRWRDRTACTSTSPYKMSPTARAS